MLSRKSFYLFKNVFTENMFVYLKKKNNIKSVCVIWQNIQKSWISLFKFAQLLFTSVFQYFKTFNGFKTVFNTFIVERLGSFCDTMWLFIYNKFFL